jgi:acetyl esterase
VEKETWVYNSKQDLAPGIRRLLRIEEWAPRVERLPVPVSRFLMEISTRFTSPARNPRVSETIHAPFKDSSIRLRRLEPGALKGPRPIVLFIHGGGWVLGSSRTHRAFCELLADEAQCSVFSLDYRLAPEHPYPAAIQDVERAYEWLLEQREAWGWQTQPIVVSGDSAGGNLATILCRRRRDRQETLPDAQLLLYPVTDFAQNSLSYQKYALGFMLTRPMIDWFFLHYQAAGQHEHQDVSPLRCEDLRGLPPTFIGLAGCDVLLDEGRAYARRLQEAGVPVQVRVFPNMIHAFVMFLVVPEAHAAALECISFLQDLFQKHQSSRKETNDGTQQSSNRRSALAT